MSLFYYNQNIIIFNPLRNNKCKKRSSMALNIQKEALGIKCILPMMYLYKNLPKSYQDSRFNYELVENSGRQKNIFSDTKGIQRRKSRWLETL